MEIYQKFKKDGLDPEDLLKMEFKKLESFGEIGCNF